MTSFDTIDQNIIFIDILGHTVSHMHAKWLHAYQMCNQVMMTKLNSLLKPIVNLFLEV
jgi:hypothetical protein